MKKKKKWRDKGNQEEVGLKYKVIKIDLSYLQP